MRSAKTRGEKAINWELSIKNTKPYLEEMPHLKPLHDGLEAVITRLKDVDSRQEVARAQARELTRERQEIEREGEALHRRMASHLRGTLGFTSEKLIEFGINPRPRRTRPRKEQPAPSSNGSSNGSTP
jgi:hypothetical protein